jgi:hypothetical protein
MPELLALEPKGSDSGCCVTASAGILGKEEGRSPALELKGAALGDLSSAESGWCMPALVKSTLHSEVTASSPSTVLITLLSVFKSRCVFRQHATLILDLLEDLHVRSRPGVY